MKKILFAVAILCCIASCGSKKTEKNETTAGSEAVNVQGYKLDSLLVVADRFIDKEVTVRGFVTHTCEHSGKRCFIVGDDQKVSMRIEAKGEIVGFNRELIGSELAVTGVLKERRLSKEYIDQHEKEVHKKKAAEDGSAETCEAELSNINEMRAWMKKNNKDHYSLYYMDGEKYDVIEN